MFKSKQTFHNLLTKLIAHKWIKPLYYFILYSHIFFRYLSTWFAFDVCSTAPFQSLSLLFNYNGSEIGFRVLSMLRLWRLRRVSSLFARFIFNNKNISRPFLISCSYSLSLSLYCSFASGLRKTSASTTSGHVAQNSFQ